MAITRTALTDDDGSGTTGTVINNAVKTELYNQIDAALVAGGAFTLPLNGVVFPATQVSSGGANTLDDYEEGAWAPTANGVTFSVTTGLYVKIGQLVVATWRVTWPSTADTGQARLQSFPFSSNSSVSGIAGGGYVSFTDATVTPIYIHMDANVVHVGFYTSSGTAVSNASMSSHDVRGVCVYRANA